MAQFGGIVFTRLQTKCLLVLLTVSNVSVGLIISTIVPFHLGPNEDSFVPTKLLLFVVALLCVIIYFFGLLATIGENEAALVVFGITVGTLFLFSSGGVLVPLTMLIVDAIRVKIENCMEYIWPVVILCCISVILYISAALALKLKCFLRDERHSMSGGQTGLTTTEVNAVRETNIGNGGSCA